MKLTAVFDSVNSADLAAADIRKNVSLFSDICITEKRPYKSFTSDRSLRTFCSYNPSLNQHIYSLPVSTSGIYSNTINDMNETDLRTEATLDVIFKENDRKKISGIVICHGGREISLYD